MKNWEIKKLGDVCEKLFAGGDVPKGNSSKFETDVFSVPIFSNGEKNKGLYGYTDVARVTKPSITISARGTIGYSEIRDKPFYPAIRLIVVIPKSNILDLTFLKYVVSGIDFKHSGSSIPQLTVPMIKGYPIPLPSLPEQRRIVAILDEAFSAIAEAKANAEQNLKNSKELFDSYLQSVFESKGEGWEETCLKNEIDLLTGFAFKSKEYTEMQEDIMLLRGDNIMQGNLRWEEVKRWRKAEYKNFEKYQLQENDIVLAMDRPWVKAGLKIARLTKNDLPALLVQRTACLRNKSKVDNSFLFYLLKSNGFMNYLIDVQTGIGVPHISGKQILDFTFSRPSMKVQQTIVQKLDALSTETKKLEAIYQKKINDLEELKKSVLQKAFSGELKTKETVAV
jgi:type I restriction enzyme S subunit